MLHRRLILALPLAALLPVSARANAASVLSGSSRLLERFKTHESWEGVWNLLGASQAVGVDNDPQALLATADNALRNEVDARLAVYLPGDEPVATYPVVVANILASALDALADVLAARVAPGGRVALSGILRGQEDELLQRYAAWFDDLQVATEDDWVRIEGVRR